MIQWFPLLYIMGNAASIIGTDISLIPSLLKVFAMFQMCLFYYKHNEEWSVIEAIAINYSNCDIRTGLFLKVNTVKEMIPKFVLNTELTYVGLSWIIFFLKKINYDIKENIHPDWLNKGPCYNTDICYKFHETVFADFIRT